MRQVSDEFYLQQMTEVNVCVGVQIRKKSYPPQARMDRTDIGTLIIPNIEMSDSGIYMCVGSNSIGSNSAPVKVTVLKGEMSW